jgi:ABC-type uncharacterized transport system YnjBCD ATPase subunit
MVLEYLPVHLPLSKITQSCDGKYTSTMDPMGLGKSSLLGMVIG